MQLIFYNCGYFRVEMELYISLDKTHLFGIKFNICLNDDYSQ